MRWVHQGGVERGDFELASTEGAALVFDEATGVSLGPWAAAVTVPHIFVYIHEQQAKLQPAQMCLYN